MDGNQEPNKRRKRRGHLLFWVIFLEVLLLLGAIAYLIWTVGEANRQDIDSITAPPIQYKETERLTEAESYVPAPEIDEQLLTINPYSRPGTKIKSLDYIVIHYLGNPRTTAQENHDYFESLAKLKNSYMSANYVIGLDGEIIHCVPDDEVAFASNNANEYSISIENCHPDSAGKLKTVTYQSLVMLTAYLSEKYGLDREHIIRHYDVTGKECPLYFVEHEDKWEEFRDDVMNYREECYEEAQSLLPQTERPVDELTAFLADHAQKEQEQENTGE